MFKLTPHALSAFVLSLTITPLWADPGGALWRDVEVSAAAATLDEQATAPRHYRLLTLDTELLKQRLSSPPGGSQVAAQAGETVLELPLPEGGQQSFRLTPSGVMAPELAAKYPDIKSYAGTALDDPRVRLRLDWSPAGLNAMITTPQEVILIEPAAPLQPALYRSFNRREAPRLPWREGELPHEPGSATEPSVKTLAEPVTAVGDQLRTYRIAIAADSSYTREVGLIDLWGLEAVSVDKQTNHGVMEQFQL